jgi:predicted SnoaL-like aldol condensation-catalyzing enzyme
MSKKKPFKVISLKESGEKEFSLRVLKDGQEVIIKFFKNFFSENPTQAALEHRSKFIEPSKKWFLEAVADVLNHETKLSDEEVKVVGELFKLDDNGSIVTNFDY